MLLHSNEMLLDIILTQKGRKELAKGKLKIKYYAFGDDEVDYQAQNGQSPAPSHLIEDPLVTDGGLFLVTDTGDFIAADF